MLLVVKLCLAVSDNLKYAFRAGPTRSNFFLDSHKCCSPHLIYYCYLIYVKDAQELFAQLIMELDTCINEISSIADYERFFLGQTTEMQNCAAAGSIAIVNIAEFRNDSFIISSRAINTI